MKESRISSFFIILVVLFLHLILGWLLAQASFQKVKIDDFLETLQMVEVNLGVPESSPIIEEEIKIEEPELPKPQQEVIATKVETEADIVNKLEPVKPEEEKKPPKPKPKPKKVEKKVKAPIKKDIVKKVEKSNVNQTAPNGPVGQANGVKGSQSTQGNGNKNASLGAGYGNAMRGVCSDLSDEADDEGRVKLKVTISENGKAQNVQVISSSGIKRLDNQAKRIASNHTYSPAKLNGKAVVADVVFSINFKCGNAA
ncbi:outer membrane transport energization protein TonB [Bisgaardia hudsonensis]|uniref:Protein TonB n=1 Tax=Bisgaardia hudsonensis TaxID=109472 RepID=A0A4R2MUE5_9PAST|nr:energy transducer TonB [Bisgaardia hudsonensis]QLB12123.1 hypothetical protein A6A11_00100 [Bisgaardia hudsonensis]TCP11481.1 outer membrane transport energization protein TonB [Bisgaardia hudsonensis]